MKPVWLRILPYIAAVALVAAALFGAYRHGISVTDSRWQAEWNARDAKDAQARTDNEAAERAKEQARQLSINKAIQDGQRTIDQATADAVSARNAADSLRGAGHNAIHVLLAGAKGRIRSFFRGRKLKDLKRIKAARFDSAKINREIARVTPC